MTESYPSVCTLVTVEADKSVYEKKTYERDFGDGRKAIKINKAGFLIGFSLSSARGIVVCFDWTRAPSIQHHFENHLKFKQRINEIKGFHESLYVFIPSYCRPFEGDIGDRIQVDGPFTAPG